MRKERTAMEKMLQYIRQKYAPLSIIVYGSYADGSNRINSDFDALVISEHCAAFHDAAQIGAVQLDVFVYPRSQFENGFDCREFFQIHDGIIVLDTDGFGASIQSQVQNALELLPKKTPDEVRQEIAWCKKMLLRTERRSAEGLYRWHWLLTESLEIYCDAHKKTYLGPKKALRWMEAEHPEAFRHYSRALLHFDQQSLQSWISYLEKQS